MKNDHFVIKSKTVLCFIDFLISCSFENVLRATENAEFDVKLLEIRNACQFVVLNFVMKISSNKVEDSILSSIKKAKHFKSNV